MSELQEVMSATADLLKKMDKQLNQLQQDATRSRFLLGAAVESSPKSTFDDRIKGQICTESLGTIFAKVIEARTHLDVAVRALEMQRNSDS
jgi:hypothetical protein